MKLKNLLSGSLALCASAALLAGGMTANISGNIVNAAGITFQNTQDGVYEVKVNKAVDYSKLPEKDKMIGFAWKQFGIKSGEYATKIEFNLSAGKELGTWVGAFGSSTTVAPEYWTMTKDETKSLSGTTATVTWTPSAADAKIFAYQGGDLKFGVWWIDCGQFTVDSIKVYTSGGTGSTPDPTPSPTPTSSGTSAGDANGDGKVNVRDAAFIAAKLAQGKSGDIPAKADFNGDGKVNVRDAAAIAKYLAAGNK